MLFRLILALFPAAALWAAPPMPTPSIAVTNTYHGVEVIDEYQWLEAATNPAVRQWTAQQNELTRHYFEQLPVRLSIATELRQMDEESSASYFNFQRRGSRMFSLRFKPPQQQPVLISFPSPARLFPREIILDPNTLNLNGTTAIDWFTVSSDGHLVAVSLSENGSEDGSLFFYETATGRSLPDRIPRVQYPTAGGSAAWNADGTGIFYTRYPNKGERPDTDLHFFQQVWFHRLGTAAATDRYEIGREFPRIAEITLRMREDGRYLLAEVQKGDGGEFEFWLRDSRSSAWRPIARFADEVKNAVFGQDDALYLLSVKKAPRGQVLRWALNATNLLQAQVVVPESRAVLEGLAPSRHGLYVADLVGGPSQIRYFKQGKTKGVTLPIPPVSSVRSLKCWEEDELYFWNTSYTEPGALFSFQPNAKQPEPTAIRTCVPVSFQDIEVVRAFAPSKDGTEVPLNILRRKDTRLDGANPTLLTGYGGYNISLTPYFDPGLRIWFDAGGVYVVANLRGGGEYGEAWHQAGNLTRKQHVFDDFIGCAEYLIKERYTTPARLAVEGGSNGGLLMGAFLTQRPDLARAVVSLVGIYDMLRVELDPNGQFNTTEFGSVKEFEQFRALYAYSPYHHVGDGTAYPAILLTAGENDGRVNPAHSKKMTARLQAANVSPHPVLLRTTSTAGHGIGTSFDEAILQQADVFAFLFDQLGMKTEKP
jgi:prolyl oligopeptidase